jgi:hypothetical protein
MFLGLATVGLASAMVPAKAFWPRSQWLACSEAAIAADYQRWRCWELDGYAGEIAPAYGRGDDRGAIPVRPRSLRRDGKVQRRG